MIPKVCHVVSFKDPFIQNSTIVHDNNLQTHLNPMRVEPEEEKYDIESNHHDNTIEVNGSENLVTVKNKNYCCTCKHIFNYIAVVIITAILLMVLLYIMYITK